MIVLVTDRIYVKTRRLLAKLVRAGDSAPIVLARVSGFPDGLPIDELRSLVSQTLDGSVEEIANQIGMVCGARDLVRIVALNESAILPALALQRLLGLPERTGYLESCDKIQTRRLLGRSLTLAVATAWAHPGGIPHGAPFVASRYVVKPAFGMSSRDVKWADTWEAAVAAAVMEPGQAWVPEHVARVLEIERSDTRIIEEYIDGTEFSIDGWIDGDRFQAIVQHKLAMVRTSFIGDGPTVSPPIGHCSDPRWSPLRTPERDVCQVGCEALSLLGFKRGVFHIEGRERACDQSIQIVEINPRAPGGSLWRSAYLRTGLDLELVDAQLQLGLPISTHDVISPPHVLHYPYYAFSVGVLKDWGDLAAELGRLPADIRVDFAATLGDRFTSADLTEEPYLAFAVGQASDQAKLLTLIDHLLKLKPPTVESLA
ncbi:MAG TPA: ATP-grasp domain-containing protein [Vicinamibacterales bacterium]|nr:ATP-grasp domain-containing protein [Vicinamibacterales bacterium]